MRSNNADGFHSKSAQIGPSYRNCIARYNGDDGFAISGNYNVITENNGNLLTVIGKAGFTPDIFVGDMVELVSYDGTRLPDATVVSIKAGRPLNATEVQVFIGCINYYCNTWPSIAHVLKPMTDQGLKKHAPIK